MMVLLGGLFNLDFKEVAKKCKVVLLHHT
jgi:hypothetical protein